MWSVSGLLATTQTFSSEDKSTVFIEIIPSGQKKALFLWDGYYSNLYIKKSIIKTDQWEN